MRLRWKGRKKGNVKMKRNSCSNVWLASDVRYGSGSKSSIIYLFVFIIQGGKKEVGHGLVETWWACNKASVFGIDTPKFHGFWQLAFLIFNFNTLLSEISKHLNMPHFVNFLLNWGSEFRKFTLGIESNLKIFGRILLFSHGSAVQKTFC